MAEESTKTIRIVVDASRAIDGSAAATRALEKLNQQAGSMDTTLSRMEKSLGSLGSMAKAQLSLMIAELGSRLVAMGKDALNAAAGLDELAEQLGVTTKFLQASQFSAVQNGVKLEQLETAYSKFSQKMGEAADGSKEMIEALDKLGVKNLDVAGKLRPTEALMSDVAEAILKIDEPAKRAAAAVDFFGKAGTRLLPMLADIAAGADAMARKAAAAGVMIDEKVIKQLDKLADHSEVSALKFRALIATLGAPIATAAMEAVDRILGDILGKLNQLRAQGQASEQGILPENDQAMVLQRYEHWRTEAAKKENRNNALVQTKYGRARQAFEAMTASAGSIDVTPDPSERLAILAQQNATQLLVSGTFPPTEPPAPDGAKLSGIKGAGEDVAERMRKALQEASRDYDQAKAFAEAATQGADAVAKLEIHFKALKTAQDVFGKAANDNADVMVALTRKLEDTAQAALKLKTLGEFGFATSELEKANELLAAENALINASTETRAREIALIKLKQEVQAKGLDESNAAEKAAIDRRADAITQNERLKAQGEELRKANELWTEPLKGALQSIQSTAADMWERILENGKFSLQEFGQLFVKTARRAAAELLALGTIRPVIGMGVQALGSMGLVSPQTAASLGYGGGAGFGMPGAGGMSGGFSSMTMPSWLGGGQPFSFLSNPIFPNAGPATAGASPASAMFPTGATSAGFGGITWGQGLGAVAGIGSGIYQLATARGNTGKTLGGIGSMIGAGVSLIPGMQPIGMGISLLSSILPSLFGGDEYKWDPLAGANVQFNAGAKGYSMAETQQLGGKSIGGQYGSVGTTLDAFFKAAGGITDASKAFGAAIWQNQREGTLSTYEISPSQGSHQLSEGSGDQSAAVDRMIAKVFYNSIQNNAAMNASPTLRQAFTNREPTTTAQISGLLDLIKTYDALGKETTKAETALKQVDDSFVSLTATAKEWGLSLDPITTELEKQRKAYAEDFLHTINSVLDPVGTALDDFAKERADGLKEWRYINDNVKGVVIEQAKVEEYYARKESALRDQLYGGAISQLEDAIRRLSPGGALANLDPSAQLAGMKASYRATYGQAVGGDAAAITRLAGEGADLASYGKSYFAGSPEYNALRDEILANLRTIQAAVSAPAAGSPALDTGDPALQNLVQQLQVSTQLNNAQAQQISQLMNELARTNNLLSRYLTNAA